MVLLAASTPLEQDPVDVFAWHERPGAVVRLTPPGVGRVESGPSDGLRVGSRTVLRVAVPGARLPGLRPVGLRWVSRHSAYDPPRGFVDEMESGPLRSWRHERELVPERGGTRFTERITYELPRATHLPLLGRVGADEVDRRLRRLLAYRGRTLAADLDFHAANPSERRTILLAGASGLVGTQLAALLSGGGHEVRRLVRHTADAARGEVRWDPATASFDPAALGDVDVVINLAGHPIAGRFTPAHLRLVRESRVDATRLLATGLASRAGDGRPRALINASASGYYGPDREDEPLTEDAPAGDGELAAIVAAWEEATRPASEAGVRVAVVRTGIVQSPAGGQLGLQLPLFTWGLGGPLGSGRAWMPWVGIDDLVCAYAFLALSDLEGPFNVSAPEPVRGEEYARTLASVLGRPAALRVPRQAPALLLGEAGAREFALAGQRMLPARLQQVGFAFRYPALSGALEHVLAATEEGPTTI